MPQQESDPRADNRSHDKSGREFRFFPKRDKFLPPSPSATDEELALLLEHMDAIWQLKNRCFNHLADVIANLEKQLGKYPKPHQILNALDEGHVAWFAEWIDIDCQSGLNINQKSLKWDDWYADWRPWFEEHHPHYFVEDEETS